MLRSLSCHVVLLMIASLYSHPLHKFFELFFGLDWNQEEAFAGFIVEAESMVRPWALHVNVYFNLNV